MGRLGGQRAELAVHLSDVMLPQKTIGCFHVGDARPPQLLRQVETGVTIPATGAAIRRTPIFD